MFHMNPLRRAGSVMLGISAACIAFAAPASVEARSAIVPPFTDAQAQSGAALYKAACAICHGADLSGNFQTPSLQGRLVARWAGTPVSKLSFYIQHAMPQMAPGSLSDEQVATLVAFILQQNGAKPGSVPLPDTEKQQSRFIFPAIPPQFTTFNEK